MMQACSEMVMPMSSSDETSMFPTYDFNYSSYQEDCLKNFGVQPRPKWITTHFGGHVSEWHITVYPNLNISKTPALLPPQEQKERMKERSSSCSDVERNNFSFSIWLF